MKNEKPNRMQKLAGQSHPRGGDTNKINIAPKRVDPKTEPKEKRLPKKESK